MPGGAVSDIALLSRCAEFTLSHSRDIEEAVSKELETSTATSLIMTLRMLRLQRAILALGMFSLFESLLQTYMKWDPPLEELDVFLKQHESYELARTFNDYKLAINVLKHGRGWSYEQLSARSADLDFKVKPEGENFFLEGDVSEVGLLIDVDDKFVMRCARLIEEASALIRSKEQVWI